MANRTTLAVLYLAAAASLSACGSAAKLIPGRGGDTDNQLEAGLNEGGLNVYLETMGALVDGDPVEQVESFEAAKRAAEWAPTTTNRLRFALALATPGHPSADPLEAQGLLNELMASRDALLPEERMLAAVHLKEVEQRLILDREAERLKAAAEAGELSQRQIQDLTRRLRQSQATNARLQAELRRAQEKLEAITSIEQSIRERSDDTP